LAGLILLVLRRAMLRRLGGFTGDTAGALVELTEVAVLLALTL
jgi:adenosylcobinamide-GDP ribazoletransferase